MNCKSEFTYKQAGGWGAKLSAGALDTILKNFPVHKDKNLLVGFNTADDAAVYKINDETAIIQTVDFFPAISNDPYIFGQIAAANSLSDIYAMGGSPKIALNLFCVPRKMPENMVKEILKGGFDKVFEAGAIICGGHTIYDDIPKYGLAVTGFVHPEKIIKNSTAKEGDILILTKPLGSGILTTALKSEQVSKSEITELYEVMAFLNATAKDIMIKYPVSACTDITGFGLLGHLFEMLKASGTSAEINFKSLPCFPSSIENAEKGFLPGGAKSNKEYVGGAVQFIETPLAYQDLMFDPQTSGGLLIAVNEKDGLKLYQELTSALKNTVCGKPAIIGKVIKKSETLISVKPDLN